ncbi:MAG: glycosyltransferase family A protein [Halobacteriales archaeon]|nr:glycosyltransferase family A protein [Halobacteriales archaeon]
MALVSTVVPTFDRRDLLEQAVESVRLQTYEPVECIVVDDGSTDGTSEYLDSLDYDEMTVVRHEENHGQSVARNEGIKAANGEYVLFLDSDDILYPCAAESLVSAVEGSSEDVVGAFASAKLVNHRGRVKKRTVPAGRMDEASLENANAIGGISCTLFRRTVLEDVGGFDESLPRRVDVDLYLKILDEHALYGFDEFCCERRIHDEGLSSDTDAVEESYRKIAENHGVERERRR